MSIESQNDILALREIGKIVGRIRDTMLARVRPGVSTRQLDQIAGRMFKKHGVKSAPNHCYNFPGFTCISVNNEIAHGIPSDRILKEGDIVNIDVSGELNGYFGDTGASTRVGQVAPREEKILACAKKALAAGLKKAVAGNRINKIGAAIHEQARSAGFKVIKNLAGHGIGHTLHEEPSVLNYYDPRDKLVLNPGLVLAVEVFISTGVEYVSEAADGWTLLTPAGHTGAQFEHTIIVTENEPLIMTA